MYVNESRQPPRLTGGCHEEGGRPPGELGRTARDPLHWMFGHQKERRHVEGRRNHVHVARRLRRRPQRWRGRSVRLVLHLGRRRIPHRRVGPHDVQGVRAERRAPSRSHVRTWCRAHRPTHLRRRPRLGRKSRLGTSIRTYPPHPRRMAATQLDCPLRDRRHRKRREPSQSRRRREVRWGPRRGHHPAVPECRRSSTKSTSTSRRCFLAPEFDSSTTSPARQSSLATRR